MIYGKLIILNPRHSRVYFVCFLHKSEPTKGVKILRNAAVDKSISLLNARVNQFPPMGINADDRAER